MLIVPYVLKKEKAGKEEFIAVLSCTVQALGPFCTNLPSQGTSENAISSPWNDISCKSLPSFSSIYLILFQLQYNFLISLGKPSLTLCLPIPIPHLLPEDNSQCALLSLSCNSFRGLFSVWS